MINGIAMKGRKIIIPFILHKYMSSYTVTIWALEDETFIKRVSVLDEHECRHQKHCKTVCYIPGISANTTIQEDKPT